MHRKESGTGNPKIPPHVQDAKLTWYQMKQKAELSTGMSSDDKNNYFLKENGFNSIPNEIIKCKQLNGKPSIQDIIELPDSDSDSDSDNSNAFMTRPPFKKVKQESSTNNINTIIKKEVTDNDAKPEVMVAVGLAKTVTVAVVAMTKTDRAKRDLSGVMMYRPSNNNKKKQQDLFEMMSMQTYGSREETKRGNIEKCKHDRECCHQELIMVLIASITGKQNIDNVHNTNPPLGSPLSLAKNKRIPEMISYQDQDKNEKIGEDEST
eukprot:12994242-Ditylum_brightwellii.AAC.1